MTYKNLMPIKQLLLAVGIPGYLLFSYNILMFFIKRQRSLNDFNSVDSSAFFQILFAILIFILSFYTFSKSSKIKRKFLISKPNIYLLCYIIICFLSSFWSPDMRLSFYRAFESLSFLMLISWIMYNLGSKLDVQNIIEWFILLVIWTIIWNILTNIKLYGFSYFINNPFDIARLEYPMAIFFALLLSKRFYFKYIILTLAFLSFSNKIYLGFVLGCIGYLFGNSNNKKIIFLFLIIMTFALLAFDLNSILLETVFIGREEISLSNTSGRDKVWRTAWEAFKQSPYLGYGFVSGESLVLYDKFKGAIGTHSFIFSGLLGSGLLGTYFLLLYFGTSFKIVFSRLWPKNNWKVAVISTLIMSFVVSLSAPGVGGRVYGSWTSVVLVISILKLLNYKFRNIKVS